MKLIRQTAWYGVPVTIAAILALALLFAGPAQKAFAHAPATITQNGDVSVSLGTYETARYTDVPEIILAVSVNGEVTAALNFELFIQAGWAFDTTAGAVTVKNNETDDGIRFSGANSATFTALATNLVVSITTNSDAADLIEISGLRVRPTAFNSAAANICITFEAGDDSIADCLAATHFIGDIATITPVAPALAIAGTDAANRAPGKSDAEHTVSIVSTNKNATGVQITLPNGYVVASAIATSAIVSSATGACSTTASRICVVGSNDEGTVSSVTTNTTNRTILVGFSADNLSGGAVEFTITAGITNPAVGGGYHGLYYIVETTGGTAEEWSLAHSGIGTVAVTPATANTLVVSPTASLSASGSVTYATYRGSPLVNDTPVVWTLTGTASAVFSANGETTLISSDLSSATTEYTSTTTFKRWNNSTDLLNTQQILMTGTGGSLTVTVVAQGFTSSKTLTISGGGAAATITPPTGTKTLAKTVTAAADAINLDFLVKNASAVAVPNGTLFTASLSGPGLLRVTGTLCDALGSALLASCTGGIVDNSNGRARVAMAATNVSGTVTVSVISGGITATKDVTVTGSVSTVTAGTPTNASLGTGSSNVTVTVKDSDGNVMPGQIVVITVSTALAIPVTVVNNTANGLVPACSAGTSATGTCNVAVTAGSTATLGDHTLKVAVGTKSSTFTINKVGALDAVVLTAAEATVDAGASTTITVTATTATGGSAADGTAVSTGAAGGVLLGCGTVLNDGKITCTFVAPGTSQDVTITSLVGTGTTQKIGSMTITVGAGTVTVATPAAPTLNVLTDPGAGKATLGVTGTTDVAAFSDAQCGGNGATLVAVFNVTTQAYRTYINGGPAIVNDLVGNMTATDIAWAVC